MRSETKLILPMLNTKLFMDKIHNYHNHHEGIKKEILRKKNQHYSSHSKQHGCLKD